MFGPYPWISWIIGFFVIVFVFWFLFHVLMHLF